MDKEITLIPAKIKLGSKAEISNKKIRVAAYCRVSTDQEEQEGSYKIQVEHYRSFIEKHQEWKLAGIYADEGISGLNIKDRTEFKRMMNDCRNGKIDMIITKSISRFARNTVDCLQHVRELRLLQIPVYFESENINSCDIKGEVMLTILASLAQQESENISRNVKLAFKFRYQKGFVMVNHKKFLGYDRDEDGELVINEKEAAVVRKIFNEYLAGKSPRDIANSLEADGILTGAGKERWRSSTILKMLQNEKYIGDNLTQKTITVDTLNKVRKVNKGQEDQYYIKNSHPAIIDRETFELVSKEIMRRRMLYQEKKRIYASKYALSDFCKCGKCGSRFYRVTRYTPKKYCVWICGQRLYCKDACKCEMRILKEQQLQEYVIEALKGSGMPVEDGYSDKIVRKYIKKVAIYEEYVLVDIFD